MYNLRIAAPLAVGLLSACGSSNHSSSQNAAGALVVPYAATPLSDPFYATPSPLPQVAPGTVLDYRPITFAPLLGKPLSNPAWQVQFLSKDSNGRPIAAIVTVVKPLTPVVGTMPLLAIMMGEDSLGSKCAPSQSLSGSLANPEPQAEAPNVLWALDQGWTVISPDHEGPNSEYAAGRIAGQITLDSVRAALSLPELELAPTTPVGLWGYSGGAIAAAWAASLQASYAPELNIVALASGGTPADLIGVAKNADTNPATNAAFFNLVFAAIEGINRAYPDLVTPIANDQGKAAMESMKDGCLGLTPKGTPVPKGHFADYVTTDDPFNSPGALATTPLITLPLTGHTPTTDAFVYHGEKDELIPIAGTDTMVAGWCAAGAHVNYYRAATAGHISLFVEGAPMARAFLQGRFSGNPADVVPEGTTSCN
jgi:hypothetical protein